MCAHALTSRSTVGVWCIIPGTAGNQVRAYKDLPLGGSTVGLGPRPYIGLPVPGTVLLGHSDWYDFLVLVHARS